MNEILLTYPRVLLGHARGTKFWILPEIKTGEYGYRLKVGQQLRYIRYQGTRFFTLILPRILEINEEGLRVETPGIRGRKDICFLTWEKTLPDWGEPRALYIEPCGFLSETKTMEELLAGREAPMWYVDGEWGPDPLSMENLMNFERVEQGGLG
jgi:hypothetical protein